MAEIRVCEDHPRRTRGLVRFVYVDADGIVYRRDMCGECAEAEIEEGFEDWAQQPDGSFRCEQVRLLTRDGACLPPG